MPSRSPARPAPPDPVRPPDTSPSGQDPKVSPARTTPTVGDPAPHFDLPGDDGQRYSLAALRPIDANAVVEALIDCVPATLFHLPVADGNEASASSSYAMLPLDDGPAPATAEEEDEDEGEDDSEDDSEDEGDDQLTRPVVALQRGRGRGRGPSKHSPSKHSTANHSPSKHSTASHLLNQPPPPRPVTARQHQGADGDHGLVVLNPSKADVQRVRAARVTSRATSA